MNVALIWPGGVFTFEGNFGVPQLLALASAALQTGCAELTLYDLDAERLLQGFSVEAFRQRAYDIVAISCYSSYDYLKVMALGLQLRPYAAEAWFVVGGYHASACPEDFTGRGSPFDYVVSGEGEHALAELVRQRSAGTPPHERVLLGTAALPSSLIPYPFELLERYRPVLSRGVDRVEISLSRGCPYGCSFCMERSKRTVAWRALAVDEAMDQIERLTRFVDLRGKTLRFTDALFGASREWRRSFLERLIERPPKAEKIWLLCRADLLEEEDFRLMARANAAPGFGLESGDAGVLENTGKVRGSVEAFHERLFDIATWARAYQVPFGANVIVGLPGETTESLQRTARYLDRLFLGSEPCMGFFGIDRYRLYPGSQIAENLDSWRERTGFFPHRPKWWLDGDQDFLSEWNDPSAELDFERCMGSCFELFPRRLGALKQSFAYTGPARAKFVATISHNLASFASEARRRQEALLALWKPLEGISL